MAAGSTDVNNGDRVKSQNLPPVVPNNQPPESQGTADGASETASQPASHLADNNKSPGKESPSDSAQPIKEGLSPDSSSDATERGNSISNQDISVAKVEVAAADDNLGIAESSIKETLNNNKESSKLAVIVLALGLGITAILLLFVGCRLRNVKRRLRRGRPLNSNEADYLINGMYL